MKQNAWENVINVATKTVTIQKQITPPMIFSSRCDGAFCYEGRRHGTRSDNNGTKEIQDQYNGMI